MIVRPDDIAIDIDDDTARQMTARSDPACRDLLDLGPKDSAIARRVIGELLAGRIDDAQRRRVHDVIAASALRLPGGMDIMLAHLGVDPDCALALCIAAGPLMVSLHKHSAVRDYGVVGNIALETRDMTWVRMGDGVTWRDEHILAPRLPDVAAVALVGSPLRRVLSHPALDPLDVTIVDVADCWESPTYMGLVTSLHRAAA